MKTINIVVAGMLFFCYSIKAEESINFKLSDLANDVVLDFRQPADHIYSVSVEGKAVPYKLVNQHIIIEASYFSKGENTIFISFRAGDMSLNRNEEFLYTNQWCRIALLACIHPFLL